MCNEMQKPYFDFAHANAAQREAITTTDGPVLIIAGPGTGKTFTLVQRVIYLIKTGEAKPENIFIATFTEKAAKELLTRISNELMNHHITANLNEMYVGTFHSLCLRILKEHLEYTRLKKNYRTWETFEQQYMVMQHYDYFSEIAHVETVLKSNSRWQNAKTLCLYVNNLAEELVDPDKLLQSEDVEIATLGSIMKSYQQLLEEQNALDFSAIQVEAFKLLDEHPDVLERLQEKITHIMVDEYQDTNYIQEQLVFKLAGKRKNICVVGDDDQGLYRFRGATIRNILEFPQKFAEGECRIVTLDTNYRSNPDIIRFYNQWMQTTKWQDKNILKSFSWEDVEHKYRYPKIIKADEDNQDNKTKSPAVVTLTAGEGEWTENEWPRKIKNFIDEMQSTGKVTDYNQIAFLFGSVKNSKVTALIDYLEAKGINVYSPRSGMFFQRDEIMLSIGLLIYLFPKYRDDLENQSDKGSFRFLNDKRNKKDKTTYAYYKECLHKARLFLEKSENMRLRNRVTTFAEIHLKLQGNTDYAYTKLLYTLFTFLPFSEILATDMKGGVVDSRAARNLATLTQLISRFEQLNNISILSPSKIEKHTEMFFNYYLRLVVKEGVDEYEDDSEYAPSGCVSFLTIHQSKGMEFPIVFVASLQENPWGNQDALMLRVEERYFRRKAFEPQEFKIYFDFWRKYYTAFSRAQNLLVLTCDKGMEWPKEPNACFRKIYEDLPEVDNPVFDVNEFDFSSVKDVNLKRSFSFTSDIAVYETCGLQYKFFKELGFAAVHTHAMLFGTLVHETIEDVHKAVLRGETETINQENITNWFETNYDSLSKKEHSYLDKIRLEEAKRQVLNYVKRQKHNWERIRQTEVDVSLVKKDYIIKGKIDLIRGDNDTVEIVDFKSESKPDQSLAENQDKLEKYRQQLNVYAALVEERTGQTVSGMRLYYTGQEQGDPEISFPYDHTDVQRTKEQFDSTVHKIMNKDFSKCAIDRKVCNNCDFRWYCGKYAENK